MAILFFEPYSRGRCLQRVLEALGSQGARARVLRNWGLRALIDVDPIDALSRIYDYTDCVSRIAIVHSIISDRSIEKIVELAIDVAKTVFPGRRIFIDVRRWDKTYPLNSIDIARMVARTIAEKGIAIPDPHERENSIVICIDRDATYIAYSYSAIRKHKKYIPSSVVQHVVAVVDRPRTQYEIMDLIQFSRAIGFELRLYRPNKDELERVLEILAVSSLPNVKVFNDLDEIFNGIDIAIALSPYARENEAKLIEILRSNRDNVIGFVLGNEYDDVSEELRTRCSYTIRLGPASDMPMRTSTALAYVLGLALPILAGYV